MESNQPRMSANAACQGYIFPADISSMLHRYRRCLHLNDCFDFRNHVCMVFDLLGQSIYDWLKDNAFCPFPPNQIQCFARQLFNSVACKETVIFHLIKSHQMIVVATNVQAISLCMYSSSWVTINPYGSEAREYLAY